MLGYVLSLINIILNAHTHMFLIIMHALRSLGIVLIPFLK